MTNAIDATLYGLFALAGFSLVVAWLWKRYEERRDQPTTGSQTR